MSLIYKDKCAKVEVEEIECPAQSPGLIPAEHLCESWNADCTPSPLTQPDLAKAERTQIPTVVLQNPAFPVDWSLL